MIYLALNLLGDASLLLTPRDARIIIEEIKKKSKNTQEYSITHHTRNLKNNLNCGHNEFVLGESNITRIYKSGNIQITEYKNFYVVSIITQKISENNYYLIIKFSHANKEQEKYFKFTLSS